eukprot:Skav201469  [mRNA]  locus=scaffold663:65287:71913:+ [translate_table: standard]
MNRPERSVERLMCSRPAISHASRRRCPGTRPKEAGGGTRRRTHDLSFHFFSLFEVLEVLEVLEVPCCETVTRGSTRFEDPVGVPTLQPVRPGAHDPRQDAKWALELALYEASIHPATTKPLKLLSFPKTIFLSEIPKGTTAKELGAFFAHGTCAEVSFHLQSELGSWLGTTTVTFGSQERKLCRNLEHLCEVMSCLKATDLAKMQAQLKEHFLKFVFGSRDDAERASPQALRPLLTLDESAICAKLSKLSFQHIQEYGELGGSLSSELFVKDLLGKNEASYKKAASWAWYRFLDEDGEDSEVTDQHQAAFLEFDEDHDDKFSKFEVAELLLCMDKAARQQLQQQCTCSSRHDITVHVKPTGLWFLAWFCQSPLVTGFGPCLIHGVCLPA